MMTEREEQANAVLQDIAKDIKAKLPEFGEGDDKKMLYISNSQRQDVMNAMVEFLQKNLDDPKMFGKDV